MDPSFIPVEVVPTKTPFGLDQLRRSYKTALSAEDAIAAAPAVGAVDEVFPCMFLMPISTPESAESATRIDLLYIGTLQFTGTGVDGDPFLPVLPAQKHDTTNAVQTASSSRGKDGTLLSSPVTVQYYAPAQVLTYFSFGAPGTEVPDDPANDPVIITLTIGDTAYSSSTFSVPYYINNFFVVQIITTQDSTELVPGKFWQNVARKTEVYTAYIYDLPPGAYAIPHSAGHNYTPGDTLTIAGGGGTAVVTVDVIINTAVPGQIWSVSQVSNTCTTNALNVPATGGTGLGATFDIIILV
jgi:hypothetical protein